MGARPLVYHLTPEKEKRLVEGWKKVVHDLPVNAAESVWHQEGKVWA